jgi:DNA-binding transcriptional regulator YdaS (Cro superfamily)
MLTRDAIVHFGSQAALARALGITQPSVAGWGDVVPLGRQYQLEVITSGALRAARDAASSTPSEAA